MTDTLSNRHEFLFLYDIRMGNPNGDPDENRPRRLPDGTVYVTDVRLKRFVRDWLKTQGQSILVDRPEDAATNLTGRLQHFLNLNNTPEALKEDVQEYLKLAASKPQKKAKAKKKGDEEDSDEESEAEVSSDNSSAPLGQKLVSIILKAFIDARLFGSSLAFKDWDVAPRPKTLTGAVQINMGESRNKPQEVDIAGTSIFASSAEKTQGTFTTFYGLRYGLFAFNGLANEHSARLSRLTDADYELLLTALWKSVSSSPTANTRSKAGQVPRLLVDVTYKSKSEFQYGCLLNYVTVVPNTEIPESDLAGPQDYKLDCSKLIERLSCSQVESVRVSVHPDVQFTSALPASWQKLDFDSMGA